MPLGKTFKTRRIAYNTVRIVLGLFLIANSPVGTLIHLPPTGGPGDAIIGALWASPFIMVLAKLVELSVGILLVSNRFVPLALTIFVPVLINILGFQAFYVRAVLPVGIGMAASVLFLAWENQSTYRPLLTAKATL